MTSRSAEQPTAQLARGEAPTGFRLVALWSGGSLVRDVPSSGTIAIGRGDDVDVRIDDASVSRRHALVHLGPSIFVEDLGSSNGTWLAGQRLAANERALLPPSAVVELGSVIVRVQAPSKAARPSAPGIVFEDRSMRRLEEIIDVVAQSSISVLVLGETGVGKDVIATAIHTRGPRAQKPFVRINCGAVPETLIESEFFGHERGAFTGAVTPKTGLFEVADGGTLFLDEIGELPLAMQSKLLRVLESGEVTRLGAVKPLKVDVRFVAATNRNLEAASRAGSFRSDLLFRLDGVSIAVPPLRERPGDIAALTATFLDAACATANRAPLTVSSEALAVLVRRPWPGNVRELKNVIARTVLFAKGDALHVDDLRFESAFDGAPVPAAASFAPAALESSPDRARILGALEQCAGNQTKAAKLLGIARRTLVHKLDVLGVPRPRK